jgi:hypothetical protein
VGWWAGASGLFAMFNATCPFCGRPGCVTGAGASGLLGALVALAAADWKKLVRAIHPRRSRAMPPASGGALKRRISR